MIRLENKSAIITGSIQGIGLETARLLGRQGASVMINHYLDEAAVSRAVEVLAAEGINASGTVADVATRSGAERLVFMTRAAFGQIDILINNAGGMVRRVPVAEFDEDHYNAVLDRNLKSAFLMAQVTMDELKKARGRIVNIASLAAHDGGGPGAAVYAAAKGATVTLTRSLAKELAPFGVTVNAVSPGFIESTTFHDRFTSPEVQDKIRAAIPLGRAGTSVDVAKSVLFLVSALADWITGQSIELNGGVLMR